MFGKRPKKPIWKRKRKYLTFYVIGAGLTGVEMAGELAEWARILCDSFEIGRRI
jgi:NADH dehydrogenase